MIGEINSILLNNAIRSFAKLCDRRFFWSPPHIRCSFGLFTANRIAVKEIFIASPEKMERNIDKWILAFYDCGEGLTRF